MADGGADFQVLGSDISVLDDLDEDEQLVSDIDCVGQDLINGWTQPTGISDGTEDGATWGINVPGLLGAGMTPPQVVWLRAAMETQALRDDRIDECQVSILVSREGEATITATVTVRGQGPYLMTYTLSAGTLALAQVESLG